MYTCHDPLINRSHIFSTNPVTDTTMESHLEKCLKELEDSNLITAEKALQYFSYPCFSLATYRKGDDEPYLIFNAYMKFIRLNLHNACVEGIWEDIIRKTVMYSQFFSISSNNLHVLNDPRVIWWLDNALNSRDKCPNPYIRLVLFRLVRMFKTDWGNFNWCYLTDTFIHTICEIQPLFFYPTENEDEVLFGIIDLNCIVTLCCQMGNLKQMISSDIGRFFRKRVINLPLNQINDIDSHEIKFTLHLIQLIGVYAVMTGSITNPKQQINTIAVCFSLFKDIICNLVDCGDTFRILIKKIPFHKHVAETIRDLTSAVINLKRFYISTNRMLMSVIDDITEFLGYSRGYFSEPCDLPKMLLNRQIHGSTTLACQHSLYLRKLRLNSNEEENFVKDNDGSSVDQLSLFIYGDILYSGNYSDESENSSSNEFNDNSEYSYSIESNDESETLSNDESIDDREY